jgi:hypothetical protein
MPSWVPGENLQVIEKGAISIVVNIVATKTSFDHHMILNVK